MKLSDLLEFENIIVQGHNNPDADAIASGNAVTCFLKSQGKNVKFVYGGNFEIAKSNLKLMVSDLKIQIHHVRTQEELSELLGMSVGELPDLIVTVDSQYGEGNIQQFKSNNIAVIDHHQATSLLPTLAEVRPHQASCSTIVWDMLRKECVNVNGDINMATGLYYGLMTDSNNFSEIHHPLDMDMRDELEFNKAQITKFRNSNISQEELRIAGIALLGSEYYQDYHYSIVKADPCDPNVLGMISDMLLEVEDVECCLVYSIHDEGVKISVRSCVREVKANELAKFICEGVGEGGGHLVKAGGSIRRAMLEKENVNYTASSVQQFFREKMHRYFLDTDIIYTDDYKADVSKMTLYGRKPFQLGYVIGKDIFPVGTRATIRTLEGDQDVKIENDTYIVFGIRGEVYPISKKRFEIDYIRTDGKYLYPAEYEPSIRNIDSSKSIKLIPFAKSCEISGDGRKYAKQLKRRTKIFTRWDQERYYLGRPGDYMVVSENDHGDAFIIDHDIFDKTFEKID